MAAVDAEVTLSPTNFLAACSGLRSRWKRSSCARGSNTINLSTGLEARPVAQLVQVASQFNSEIYVEIGKKRVNAKSIMGMMTLGLDAGEEITLSANGDDENAAMESIEQYLSNQ